MAPKMKRAQEPAMVETVKPEIVEDLAFFQTCVESMAPPAFDAVVSSGAATVDDQKWNQAVLDQLLAVLAVGKSVSELYETIKATLASKVAAIGETRGFGAGEVVSLKSIIDTRVSRLFTPFYNLSRIIEVDGVSNLEKEATADDATWSALAGWAKDRMVVIIFDPENWEETERTVHFKVKGIVRSVIVATAAEKRDEWIKAKETAESLLKASSPSIAAVQKQYRLNNPAGMRDGRTKEDLGTISTVVQSGVDARASATLFDAQSNEEKEALRMAHR